MSRVIVALLILVATWAGAKSAEPFGGPAVTPVYPHNSHGSTMAVAELGAILSWVRSVSAALNRGTASEACLATAVYFEARSESLQGQLAVAMVIVNRTRAGHYPATICGVVYQGANRFNSCQFSFACDGKRDLPERGYAWDAARMVTAMALAGGVERNDEQLRVVTGALNYHADYVNPRWARSLKRLTKIGRHIFYSQS